MAPPPAEGTRGPRLLGPLASHAAMTRTEPSALPGDPAVRPGWGARLGAWSAIGLTTLPLALAALLLCMAGLPDYALDGDGALVELRIAEAVRFNQWLGSYSRLGFEHPGPLHLYLCAPFYAACDGRTGALNLAVLVLQSLALVTSLVLALRADGPRLVVAGGLAASIYIASLGQTLMTIWDPAMAILPLWLCIAGAGLAVGGRPAAAIPAVLAGSFAVQAHLSLVPPVAVALGAVTLHAVATIRNAPRETRRCYAIAIGTGLLSMLPTLVEQFWSRPGNLTLIAEALGADGPRPSLADALGITAAQLSAPVRDLLGLDEGLTTTMALAQLVAGAGAVVAAWRSESRALFGLACVALAVQASAPLAVLRIVGEIRPHMLQWIATAGAVGLWPVIAALGLGSRRSRAASLRLAAAVILGCTVVYAGATRLAAQTLVFIASVERDPGSAAGTPGLAILLDAIAAAVPDGPRDVQLRVLSADAPKPGYPDFTAGNGLVLGLKKRGFVVAPEPAHAFAYPRWIDVPGARPLHLVVFDPSNAARIVEPGKALATRDFGVVGFALFREAPTLRSP